MLTVGSCFSGIGGLELGLEWTGGFETRWQIENDEYASRVLAKHWPNVKRYTDIRDVVRPEPVDVICGGFPCQDVSLAGQRKGLEGKRSTLWGEMFRLICEIKPQWVVAENVPGLLSSDNGRFFGNILRDLDGGGMLLNGELFQLAPLEQHRCVRECSLWPTPMASDGISWTKTKKSDIQISISKTLKRGGSNRITYHSQWYELSPIQSAEFIEMTMGFPLGWTDLQGSGMPSSRKLRKGSGK